MIRRLRVLGRGLEFARCDRATAFARRKPRLQAMPDWLRNHRPDKPKFTGTGGTPVAFSQTRPANGHGRYDEKGTGFGR